MTSNNERRAAAWRDALREVAVMGATHREYGAPRETDEQLWERLRGNYNVGIRRLDYRNGRFSSPYRLAPLPAKPVPGLLAKARKAYDESTELPLIDLDRLADILREELDVVAYVEQTGGGCATVYVGPTWTDEQGDERWTVSIGPGWFDGPGWRQGYASPYELYMSRDDDGVTPSSTAPVGASLREIADMAKAHAALSAALTAVERLTHQTKTRALERASTLASGRLRWVRPATDDECELLADEVEPEIVGGEHEWRVAVYVYHLDRELRYVNEPHDDTVRVVPPGTYVRLVEGKTVHGWKVEDRAAAIAYAKAVEAEYEHTNP